MVHSRLSRALRRTECCRSAVGVLQKCYSSVMGVLQEGYGTVAVYPFLPVKHVGSRFFLSSSVCLQRVGRLTVHAEREMITELTR